jgi:hypothetical protein
MPRTGCDQMRALWFSCRLRKTATLPPSGRSSSQRDTPLQPPRRWLGASNQSALRSQSASKSVRPLRSRIVRQRSLTKSFIFARLLVDLQHVGAPLFPILDEVDVADDFQAGGGDVGLDLAREKTKRSRGKSLPRVFSLRSSLIRWRQALKLPSTQRETITVLN